MNSMTRFQKRRWRLGPSTFRIFPLAIDLTPTRPLIGSRHTQHPDKANTSSCNPFSFDHFSIREPALDSQSLNQRLQPSSVPHLSDGIGRGRTDSSCLSSSQPGTREQPTPVVTPGRSANPRPAALTFLLQSIKQCPPSARASPVPRSLHLTTSQPHQRPAPSATTTRPTPSKKEEPQNRQHHQLGIKSSPPK